MKLTLDQIKESLGGLSGWQLKGVEITKQYKFKDFLESMKFVNRIAELSEKADHHPDITIRYNRVILVLATHSEGGLTEKDFSLAKQIDQGLAL